RGLRLDGGGQLRQPEDAGQPLGDRLDRAARPEVNEDAPRDRADAAVVGPPEAAADVADQAVLEEVAVAPLQAHLVVVGDDDVVLDRFGGVRRLGCLGCSSWFGWCSWFSQGGPPSPLDD